MGTLADRERVGPEEIDQQLQKPVVFDTTADHNELESDQPAAPNPNLQLIGQVVAGKYEVLELLGEGGMSSVFLCRQQSLDQLMAIKILHCERSLSESRLKRFKQEAKATYQLNHPNLIRLLDYGTSAEHVPYLVMEYVAGTTLADRLIQRGRMSIEQFVDIFSQLLTGLAYAHARGIVHRDLKPSNIMLTKSADGTEQAKIVDFGIAKMEMLEQEQQLTRTGDIFGTPLYMSPEQCRGLKPDNRSDLYSLGCVMFEALTGSAPFRGENQMQTMFMHVEQPVPTLESLTTHAPESVAALDAIVQRLLEKNPAQRFQNALDVKKELSECLHPSQSSMAAQPRSRTVWMIGSALLICASAISFCIYRVNHIDDTSKKSNATNSTPPPVASPAVPGANTDQQDLSNAAEMALGTDDASERVFALNQQAETANHAHQYTKATLLYQRALQVADTRIGVYSGASRTVLTGFAAMLFLHHNPADYTKLDRISQRLEKFLNNPPAVPSIHQSNLYGWHGITRTRLGDYVQAFELFKKAEVEAVKGANLGQQVTWLFWQAHTLCKQGKLAQALPLYDQAEHLAGNRCPTELCQALENKGMNVWDAGMPTEARTALLRAKNIVDHNHFLKTSEEVITLNKAMERAGMLPATKPKSGTP